MNSTSQSHQWLDTSLYPFKSNYLQLSTGKMHYVDEGKGETILFVHGTPTWSFLYRDFIQSLSKNHRCIAIDHIGFGLSEKPNDFDGTPQTHANNLGEFIRRLELDNITIVVHDFGGPIGLATAIEHEKSIKQVVLFNTWLWETHSNPAALKVDKVLNSKLGKFMYLKMNFSPKVLLKKGFSDAKKLTKNTHQHYIKPFPDKASRYALLKIGQALVGSSDWYQEQWERLNAVEKKPWLILWGTKDAFITTAYLDTWKKRIPHAKVEELDAGHFVQEEKTEECINLIRAFIKS